MTAQTRILAIEEGASLLGAHRESLRKDGFSVTAVAQPRTALAHIRRICLDLIVFDKALRSAEMKPVLAATAGIPKIVMATDGRFRGVARWLRGDVAGYLCQPFEYREFQHLTSRVLELFRCRSEQASARLKYLACQTEYASYQEFSRALAAALDSEEVETIVTVKARSLMGAEAAILYLVDPESGWIECRKGSGLRKADQQMLRFRPGEGMVGRALGEGRIWCGDVKTGNRFKLNRLQTQFYRGRSIMVAPIRGRDGLDGVIEIVGRKGKVYGASDLERFSRMAEQAVFALERAGRYRRAAELSVTDDLTGLSNLRHLTSVLDNEIDRSQRYGYTVSVIFMDLDHFKDVNDSKGHMVGSKVLVEVAALLRRSLRSVDIVARYGGDEFVMVLPQTPLAAAFEIGERLRRTVERSVFLRSEGHALRLTASFGVASFPEGAKSKEDLLKMADEAMYMAKSRSRNSVYAMRY